MNSFYGNEGPDKVLGEDTIERVLTLFTDYNYISITEVDDSSDTPFGVLGLKPAPEFVRYRYLDDSTGGKITDAVSVLDNESFDRAIARGEVDVLTLDAIKALKGRTIQAFTPEYSDQRDNRVITVGDVIPELEYYRTLNEDCFPDRDGHNNRAELWEDILTPEKLRASKEKILLLDAGGKNTMIYTYVSGDGCFQCSDEGRLTSYIILK